MNLTEFRFAPLERYQNTKLKIKRQFLFAHQKLSSTECNFQHLHLLLQQSSVKNIKNMLLLILKTLQLAFSLPAFFSFSMQNVNNWINSLQGTEQDRKWKRVREREADNSLKQLHRVHIILYEYYMETGNKR